MLQRVYTYIHGMFSVSSRLRPDRSQFKQEQSHRNVPAAQCLHIRKLACPVMEHIMTKSDMFVRWDRAGAGYRHPSAWRLCLCLADGHSLLHAWSRGHASRLLATQRWHEDIICDRISGRTCRLTTKGRVITSSPCYPPSSRLSLNGSLQVRK